MSYLIMVAKNKRLTFQNEDGQSIIEFLLFLPFIIMMYSVVMSLGSAINASINQQKAARGYFYYRLANNSHYPRPSRSSTTEVSDSWTMFGTQIMGWAEKLTTGASQQPVAPCFKFALPFEEAEDDACENSYTGNTSQFIRVKTVYGSCGATYMKKDGFNVSYPRAQSYGNIQHCVIVQ